MHDLQAYANCTYKLLDCAVSYIFPMVIEMVQLKVNHVCVECICKNMTIDSLFI